MAEVPRTGVPQNWLTPQQNQYIRQYIDQYMNGVPQFQNINRDAFAQEIRNMLWRESGANRPDGTPYLNPNATGALGASGIAQITDATLRDFVRTGGPVNRMNEQDAIRAMVGLTLQHGTGGSSGAMGNQEFDFIRAPATYNMGHGRWPAWSAEGQDWADFPGGWEGRLYTAHTLRGVLPEENIPIQLRTGAWQPEGGMTAEQIEQIYANPDIQNLLIGWGHQFNQGPEGFLGQPAPWQMQGEVTPEAGHYLQTLGWMPANLLPNEQGTWSVPAGAQPGTWGAWGTPAVENWISQNQGLGTQGLQDIAGQYGFDITPGPSGTVSEHPIGGVADPSTYNLIWQPASGGWGEPGPGGVGVQAGWTELQTSGNPNNWIWNPSTLNWGTFSGGGGLGSQVQDYNQWYEDVMGGITAQPEGGTNPVGTYDPNVISVLADIQSGASNPLFAGSIWNSMPTAAQIAQATSNNTVNYSSGQNINTGGSPTIGGINLASGVNTTGQVVGGMTLSGIPLAVGLY